MYIAVLCMLQQFVRLYLTADSLTGCFFIYKCILGLFPSYLCSLLCRKFCHYGLRSQDIILLQVPKVRTELGKKGH